MQLHAIRRGDGRTVVLLHGLGDTCATWTSVAELLAVEHHVVAVDLPGHGASPTPDDPDAFTRDAALRDLDLLLAGVPVEHGRPVLVGHSLGGYLALAHAATRPGVVGGIVVLNTGPGYRDPVKRDDWNERSRRNAHRFGVPERVAALNLQHDAVVMDRVGDIEVPVLVLAGGDDREEYTSAGRYLERKLPSARLAVIPGGGHSMHVSTHVADVAAHISAFLRDLPA